nr:DUF3306 domain-containing protein [Vibrio agarilyticus]
MLRAERKRQAEQQNQDNRPQGAEGAPTNFQQASFHQETTEESSSAVEMAKHHPGESDDGAREPETSQCTPTDQTTQPHQTNAGYAQADCQSPIATLLVSDIDEESKKLALRSFFLSGEFSDVDDLVDYGQDFSQNVALSPNVASRLRQWASKRAYSDNNEALIQAEESEYQQESLEDSVTASQSVTENGTDEGVNIAPIDPTFETVSPTQAVDHSIVSRKKESPDIPS